MKPSAVVRLEPFSRGHLERTLVWVNDPDNMRLLNREKIVAPEEHDRWFDALAHRPDCRYFAVLDSTDQHVGNVWLWDVDPRHRKAEVRILIGETSARNQGAGSQSLALLGDWAKERLDLRRLYAYVLASNERAAGAFLRAGFEQEGRLRDDRWTGEQFVDALLFAKVLDRSSLHR